MPRKPTCAEKPVAPSEPQYFNSLDDLWQFMKKLEHIATVNPTPHNVKRLEAAYDLIQMQGGV